ncbi:CAP domain-containing protein [Streptomyces polygonati]|uniref:CAP domain-containing protein n=1 Tax=Streptomyces polygonati TaxID=1617087 RepID=A0ABV8HK64_9ACTN
MGRHSRHAQPAAPQPGPRGHRGRRKHHPVRTGLLASSAAMAVGAVAASSGLLSGVTGQLPHRDGEGGRLQAGQADGPGPAPAAPGSDIPSPLGGSTTPAGGPTTAPGASPAATPGGKAATPRPSASPRGTTAPAAPTKPPAPTPTRTTAAPTTPVVTLAPARTAPAETPVSSDAVTAARAQILSLVNDQRATAGCKPLTASADLDQLAQNFSDDMAARGFFDHTDPDGHTPWDRAKALGITNLGGENIARGQADAQAVMDAWMNSPGHRANILNCDYTTLGVGIHFGTGGPWWTQDFGF